MRILLNVIRGARSFEELRTVRGITHPTYQAACNALGLLGDDREWRDALTEAGQWASSFELRQLFVALILHSEVHDPAALW